MKRPYYRVDVFGAIQYGGNPVAVVLDGEGLTGEEMQQMAGWTTSPITTFVFPPMDNHADYSVRTFTPTSELSFAGHPTLGTCHAWLSAGGRPHQANVIVQESRNRLTHVRQTSNGLAFQAPPALQEDSVDEHLLAHIVSSLRISRSEIVDMCSTSIGGPEWVILLLRDANAVLGLQPGQIDINLGIAGAYPPGTSASFEAREFSLTGEYAAESPADGLFNAALASWLLKAGHAKSPFIVEQGAAIGLSGRVYISRDESGAVWVAGSTKTHVYGEISS